MSTDTTGTKASTESKNARLVGGIKFEPWQSTLTTYHTTRQMDYPAILTQWCRSSRLAQTRTAQRTYTLKYVPSVGTRTRSITNQTMKQKTENMRMTEDIAELPKWMNGVPLVSGWCRYNGRVFYAHINFEASEKANKAVFDLAYCATEALNDKYLLTREWDAKKFRRWKNNSNW